VNGKAVLCIYRSTNLPDINKTIKIWRKECLKENIELYICRFESFTEQGANFLLREIDAAIEFQPLNNNIKQYMLYKQIIRRVINKFYRMMNGYNIFSTTIDYNKYVKFQIKQTMSTYKYYPCVTPMWDNSPRRKNNFFAFYNNTPALFGIWLKNVIDKFLPYSDEENFIFINAWNEWAEGNHLEPDMRWGDSYLKEIKRITTLYQISK
jgi:hypothetical protein